MSGRLAAKLTAGLAIGAGAVAGNRLRAFYDTLDPDTAEDERFLREEIRKPMETDAIVRAARTPQVAAQVYAASVLAIEADTDVERRYLQDLAARLGLNQQAVAYVHRSLGMA